MACRRICLATLLLLSLISTSHQGSRRKRQILPNQPRIVTQDGHLVFQSGTNHNISFVSSAGGSINVDGENLKTISQLVRANKDTLDRMATAPTTIPDNIQQRLTQLSGRLDNLQPTGQVQTDLTSLTTRLTTAETQVRTNKDTLDRMATTPTGIPANVQQELNSLTARLNNLQPTGQVQTQLTTLTARVTTVEGQIPNNAASRLLSVEQSVSTMQQIQTTLQDLTNRVATAERRIMLVEQTAGNLSNPSRRVMRRLRNQGDSGGGGGQGNTDENTDSVDQDVIDELGERITAIQDRLNRLEQLLTTNECNSNPCQHGGTCMDTYNGFICQCPQEWQGRFCDTDVNECAVYAGTDLGCQNGATCTNLPGGFTCQCAANYNGIRCTETHDDCTGASQSELCGHGTCVNQARGVPNQPNFRCICDDGWTTRSGSPACTVDVDECTQGPPHCSQDPQVACINIPGSFVCGPCPTGYSGNGYSCVDINECLTNNGGCSMAPYVQCTNTRGSRTCGACPPGYQGDGVTCSWVGICNVNNGNCHPLASCRESPGISGRSCTCPSGYLGNGEGPSGCIQQGSTSGACASNPCVYGTCTNVGSSFSCACSAGYTGTRCDSAISLCSTNPCRNGGTCVQSGTTYTCRCTSDFSGPNCETPQQSCGGTLQGDSGSLVYPRVSGTTVAHSIDCVWTIQLQTRTKIVMVSFTNFNLEFHPNCNYDYLSILDGPSTSATQLGRYCGGNLPGGGTINSTTSALTLALHTDSSVASDGFNLNWLAADPVCGGDLSGSDHGSINSPGYPGNYPDNRDCVWTISVDPGNNIMFTFATLSLEHHDNCSYDYLQIRDGELATSPLLGQFCSTANPSPITTTGPYARVRFHSDSSFTDRGFHITYASVSAGQGCGGRFTADEGILISPNYPNPYDHRAECVWIITVGQSDKLQLTFTNMDLETATSCQYDFVEVRDGNSQTSPLLGKFCGTDVPSIIRTTGNTLWVMFSSDSSITGSGFRATWAVFCGGTFTAPTGSLTSPSYPAAYPHNKVCTYLISQPDGYRVTLHFTAFDVEGAVGGNCAYDFLEVRDGGSADSPLLGKFCGVEIPADQVSTQNLVFLKFQTDGSISNTGFQVSYTTDLAGCGGALTDNTGTLTSPGHPNSYPHGVNCTWSIAVQPGFVIRLTFQTFSIESHANCVFDYVEVFDNASISSSSSLGRFCGSGVPPVLTSADNVMTVIFVSDASVAHEGFSASYVGLNASTLCGAQLTDTTGMITSPNFPGNYPHERECIWTIVVPSGNQIMLNFTDFEIESHPNCNYDFLEIRNGGYPTSPLVGIYCGTNIDNPIVSHSNRLWIKFKTDVSMTGRGFRLYYDGTATGCGADMTTPTGSFVSPNYPMLYSHNAECFWTITVAQSSVIDLSFVDFDIESHTTCNYDYVEVRDGGSQGRQLGKFCGRQIPDRVTSTTNKLWVKYRTDSSVSGRGFQAFYSTSCNNRLTSFNGVLESPNFPNPYPHTRNCTWVIATTMGNTINVTFTNFDMESHTSCRYDYLQIRDGETAADAELRTMCGTTLPAPLTSSGDKLWINFVSDFSVAGNGFRLEWVTNGCGGDLIGTNGTFTSPNYPNPYPHRRECAWRITVPTGMAVRLTIDTFDLESHSDCMFDVLEAFAGMDDTGPRLTRLCHTSTAAQSLTATGNTMFVRFKSDSSVSGRGFSARYDAVQGGCGGNYSTRSGVLMSKNYPNNYEDNTECEWLISVEQGHMVQLNFTDFDVEPHTSCQYDYVAVYDGPSTSNTQLLSACGQGLPNPSLITSSTNQLFVRMRTDISVAGRGFRATYTTACGGTISADTDGELTSPNYPRNYDRNANCTWVIRGSLSTDRITLTFTHMDLEDRGQCNEDYLVVRDGDDDFSPQLALLCGNTVPAPITSQGSALTLQFVTDATIQQTGFRVTYSKSASGCGGDFTAATGSITSPGYPNSYPHNTECVWRLLVSPGNRVQVSFSTFSLENHASCQYDYLEVRRFNATGSLIGRFCGNAVPTNITAVDGVWMKFRSDSSATAAGYIANYAQVYGGQLTGSAGQVASPLFPHLYPHNVDYTWVITVSTGMRIRVSFQRIDIENFNCQYDYLDVLDGTESSSPSLGRFCGSTLPADVYSTGNTASLVFHTDASINGEGFLVSWSATSGSPVTPVTGTLPPGTTPLPGCGGDLVATFAPQNVTSPGYPSNYGNNLDCVWRIQAGQGQRIQVTVTDIDVEMHTTCNWDYLRFYDSYGLNGLALGTYCGRSPGGNATSTSNQLTARFKTDQSVSRSGFRFTYKTACGGQFSSESGVITSPNYPGNYDNNNNCSWTVTVPVGRTIRVTFNGTFNFAGSSDCSQDYVMLLNGGNAASPPLLPNSTAVTGSGKYCGSTAPVTLETSSNLLFVNFVSDGSGQAPGFSLVFQQVTVACGGRLTLTPTQTSGFLSSPGWPTSYPHNVDCEWVITVPATERVRLDFQPPFNIELHSNCLFDFVEARDGSSESADLLSKACGSTVPSTVRSTGNVLYLRFRTDNSVTREGFGARYSIETCGGRIQGENGVITSPNYPNNYSNNADCEWFLEGPTGHYLTLTFTALNLENNCTNDFVQIREINTTGPLLVQGCGSTLPAEVQTSDSFAYVRFRSNAAGTSTGFRLTFQASVEECGGDLNTPTGTFTSPNYPGAYAHNRFCRWNIQVPMGRRVSLTFSDFRLEADGSCSFDYIDVINGIIVGSPRITRLCGETAPTTAIESDGNTMSVIFRTDGSVSNGGFQASYSSDNAATCGGDLLTAGNISSPGYDQGNYTNNLHCQWIVRNPSSSNTSIALTLRDISLEPHRTCAFDVLEIREGSTADGPLLEQFCGNASDSSFDMTTVVSPATALWVRFKTDMSVTDRGFFLSYSFTNCGGILTSTSGVITSPNYPRQYGQNSMCVWQILAPEGYQIRLSFTSMAIETHTPCDFDYVEVLNGKNPDSPSIGRYCGSTLPAAILSQSNGLRVFFRSDNQSSAQGFRLTYTFDSNACGGIFHGNEGTISSPNYPRPYSNNLECIWDLNVDTGYRAVLTFNPNFTIEAHSTCNYDYVEVSDVAENGSLTSLGRWCASNVPPEITSSSTKLRVKFRSDFSATAMGFQANWTVVCGGVFTASTGFIVSPSYPNDYDNNLRCNYTIMADPSSFVVLDFTGYTFSLEGGSGCPFDYLQVNQGNTTSGALLGKFCDTTVPQPVISQGGMFLTFVTDSSLTGRGFKAVYSVRDCGGRLTAPSGVLMTPTYPNPYHHNANCTWNITVATNRIIRLKFNQFSLEVTSNCIFDSVKLFDGASYSSPLLGTFCGPVVPPVQQSSGNNMIVQFLTDSSVSQGGFQAAYYATLGPNQGCGGLLNGTSGTFGTSRLSDSQNRYLPDLTCAWTIMVADNMVATLSVPTLSLESSGNCSYDSLKIYDGPSNSHPLLGTYCGTQAPGSIVGTSNALYVVLVTDSANGGQGFNATYGQIVSLCGGTLTASSSPQNISSPNYPQPPGQTVNCRWTIDAPSSSDQVRLTLTALSLSNTQGCPSEYIQFRDFPLGTNGQSVHYCGNTLPAPFDSAGRTVQVYFSSPASSRSPGFQLTYQVADCNRNFTADNGRIVSPGWPGNYRTNMDCTIRVTAPAGSNLAFYFSFIYIEPHAQCNFDYLEVRNGSDVTSPQVAKVCGTALPDPIFLSSSSAVLHFVTDVSVQHPGYDISFTSTTQGLGCGGNLSGVNGSVTSPNYPGNYTASSTCTWTITVPQRRIVRVQFRALTSLDSSNCASNYLAIYNGASDLAPIFSRYCGNEALPAPLTASANSVFIKLVSSGTTPAPIFSIRYTS